MGVGDFVKGIGEAAGSVGEAIGGDFVVDKIQDVPNVLRSADQALDSVAAGVSHLVTNPTQIARGAGAAINFVQEHPGQAWDTAFEVGRAVVKDQLDPKNLAINAGLLGLTLATGGAAAPAALAARAAMGARAARAGSAAVQGVRAANTAVRAGKAVDRVADTVRTVDRVSDAARTVDRVTDAGRAADRVADVGRDVDRVTDVAKRSRFDAFLGGTDTAGEATTLSKTMNPVSRHVENFMQNRVRDPLATKILGTGSGQEAGLVRQGVAALVQGNTGNMPTRLAGQSENFAKIQQNMWRGRQIGKKTVGYATKAEGAEEVYDAAADPMGYAEKKAGEHEGEARALVDEHGGAVADAATEAYNPKGTGYVDRGQTAESLYEPGGTEMSSTSSSTQKRVKGESDSGPPRPVFRGGWKPSQHSWEGAGREALGGISAGHDWRSIQPLRKIEAPSVAQGKRYGAYKNKVSQWNADRNRTPAEQTAKAFSPEIPKSEMYAVSSGQQPMGALNPGMPRQLDAGPTVRPMGGGPAAGGGPSAGGPTLNNVWTARQPIGAIGPGPGEKNIGTGVIDVDSSSPDDQKFDRAGQGYFDFANMGSSVSDVGYQPPSSPMYSLGSRASRRRSGGPPALF